MTTWSELDDEGATTREVGPLTLHADCYGDFRVVLAATDGREAHLVPAQASADAAVEAIHAAMGADLGLVFVPINGEQKSLRALAADGSIYEAWWFGASWRYRRMGDAGETFRAATESDAIAAARAHDAARRGAQ